MDVRIPQLRFTGSFAGALLVAGFGVGALSYKNGFPALAAAAVGIVTIAVGAWAIATER